MELGATPSRVIVDVASRDVPDHHKYTMDLHVVNENNAVTVLRDRSHEAYHYYGIALKQYQTGLQLGHLEQPPTETLQHAVV